MKLRLAELEEAGLKISRQDMSIGKLSGLDARTEDLEGGVARLKADIEGIDAQLLRTRAEMFECEMVVRTEEAAYFHAAFTTARPPGDLIVQAMAGHQGCLVCGNRNDAAHQRARARMERHCCPVCESDVAEPAGAVSLTEARQGRLADAERRLSQSRRRHEALAQAGTDARLNLERALEDLGRTRAERRELRLVVASAEEADQRRQEIDRMKADLADRQKEVNRHQVNLLVAQNAHEKLIQAAQGDVARFRDDIIQAFDAYAKDFMVDECRLRFKTDRRGKVAQADRMIDWPAFWVELSSGEESSLTERNGGEKVSESQKEFIDLAFRMALLRAACSNQPSMLVVETPEASLDAIFMTRAGDLLREYGAAERGNVLVVSSNLTSAGMIPALLGVGTPGGEDLESREKRVVNLLRRARPTKALTTNRDAYEKAYREALGDDRGRAVPAGPPRDSEGMGGGATA